MRRSLRLLLLCALLVVTPDAAAAWTPVGTFSSPAAAAGGGWVVASVEGHQIAFLEGAIVRRRLEVGAPCYFGGVAGSQRAVAACPEAGGPDVRVAIIDLTSGATSVVDLPSYPGTLQVLPLDVGRRWLTLSYLDFGKSVRRVFWNPVTGAVVKPDGDEPLFPDLDAERPRRAPCHPVKLVRDGVGYPTPYPDARRTGRWVVSRFRDEIGAWRCGHKRPIRITCACEHIDSWGVANGFVAWPTSGGVRLMALNSRRRFSLGGPQAERPGWVRLAFGAGRRLYASARRADGRYDVFVTRLPRT